MKVFEFRKTYPLIIILFFIVFTYPALKMLLLVCGHNLQGTSFIQAIYKISFDQLNPYLTLSGSTLFSDQFSPIIYLFSLLPKTIPYSMMFVVFESLFIVLSTIPFILLHREKRIGGRYAFLAISCLFFSKAFGENIESGNYFLTWGVFPLSMLFYFIINNNNKGILFSILGVFLCGMQLMLVLPGLAIYFFLKNENDFSRKNKNHNIFVGLMVFFLLWFSLVFYLGGMNEKKIFPTIGRDFSWRVVFESILMFSPFFFTHLKSKEKYRWTFLIISGPLMAYFILNGLVGSIYGIYIPLLIIFIFLSANIKNCHNKEILEMNKIQFFYGLLCILMTNILPFMNRIDFAYYNAPIISCDGDKERLKAISDSSYYLNNNTKGAVLAEGHLALGIVKRPDLYLLFGKAKNNKGHRYLYIEKSQNGDSFPNHKEKVLEIYEEYKKNHTQEIIFDNKFIFLGRGLYF